MEKEVTSLRSAVSDHKVTVASSGRLWDCEVRSYRGMGPVLNPNPNPNANLEDSSDDGSSARENSTPSKHTTKSSAINLGSHHPTKPTKVTKTGSTNLRQIMAPRK